MQLEKAFDYINRFRWLQSFFEKTITHSEGDKGWLTAMLRNRTRYIAVRPIDKFDLSANPACCYFIPIPKAEVGVEKTVDKMAFCMTSLARFRLTKPSGRQVVYNGDIATEDQLAYSIATTFCYRFFLHDRNEFHFEYLPSTHSVADAITDLCAECGHTFRIEGDKFDYPILEPEAIVVSRLISSQTLGDIVRTFDIYDANPNPKPCKLDITYFCRTKHR